MAGDNDKMEKTRKVKVVSLFFMGTGHCADEKQDIMTTYHAAAMEQAGNGVVTALYDGPGSNGINGKGVGKSKLGAKYHTAAGNLAGDGVGTNTNDATDLYSAIADEQESNIPVLNLHGFSRGADTAMRVANQLAKKYPQIKINLFLIDQVPGPGKRNQKESYSIPNNVERMVSNLMLHENKPFFHPQDKTRHVATNETKNKIKYLIFPGWHGCATRMTGNDKTNHAAQIVHDDLYRFAIDTGTLAKGYEIPPIIKGGGGKFVKVQVKELTPEQRFKLYNDMQTNEEHYKKEMGKWYVDRKILREREQYVAVSTLFINQDHLNVFRELFPNVASKYLDDGQEFNLEQFKEEMKELDNSHDKLLEGLIEHYSNEKSTNVDVVDCTAQQLLDLDSAIAFVEHIANFHATHTGQSTSFSNDSFFSKPGKVIKSIIPASYTSEALDNIARVLLKLVTEARNNPNKAEALLNLEKDFLRERTQLLTSGKFKNNYLTCQMRNCLGFSLDSYTARVRDFLIKISNDYVKNEVVKTKLDTVYQDFMKAAEEINSNNNPGLAAIIHCRNKLSESFEKAEFSNKKLKAIGTRLQSIKPTTKRYLIALEQYTSNHWLTDANGGKKVTICKNLQKAIEGCASKLELLDLLIQARDETLELKDSDTYSGGKFGDLLDIMTIDIVMEIDHLNLESDVLKQADDDEYNSSTSYGSMRKAMAFLFTAVTQSLVQLSDFVLGVSTTI